MRLLTMLVTATVAAACGGNDTVGTSTLIAGTYRANQFIVTPTGQNPINVLAAGGSLSITIATSGATSGTLYVPPSIGGSPAGISMAGTATVTATTVIFNQQADTFVRDLTWQRVGTSLQVIDQQAGGASFTINLMRE